MSMPVTLHFDLGEFACHDAAHTPYPSEWIADRLLPLCHVLEAVRHACGDRRITIVSGYRTEQHNAAVGGAQFSQHVAGRAVDIRVEGMAPGDVHQVVLDLFRTKAIKVGGIGVYPAWVHIDTRPWIGHLAQWVGTGVGSEVA